MDPRFQELVSLVIGIASSSLVLGDYSTAGWMYRIYGEILHCIDECEVCSNEETESKA